MRDAKPAFKSIAVAVVLTGLLAACEETYTNHGFAPQIAELDTIAAGQDTRGSVLRKLGRPSSVSSFDSDQWFYSASRVEKYAFYAPKVIDRKVVSVKFDQNGLVSDVARFGMEDGRIVDLITRRTPTYGRELTVLQQIFGNLGRFDAENVFGPTGPGS
ncbi:MAG: outer membrane protein assembly factor BamE [Pseudomonadota bacterium]